MPQSFSPRRFFASGIRFVYSKNNHNISSANVNANFNANANADTDNVPLDLEVATNNNLVAGQPVLLVPYDVILTGSKAREELGPIQHVENLLEALRAKDHLPYFYLMVKILKECQKGTGSPWYDWLDSLPWYISNGSCMTELCCDLLLPLVGNLVRQEQLRFLQFFGALENVECLSPRFRKDQALAKWAFAVVYTRSIPLLDGRQNRFFSKHDAQLIPNADMFNHGTADASIDIRIDADTGNCLAVTTRNVPAGSPLRLSYNNPTNDSSYLFARYGFVDETSSVIFCMLVIENPTKDVCEMGYDTSKMLFDTRTGEASQEVWDVILYHKVLQGQKQDQHNFYKAHTTRNAVSKQEIHSRYYSQTVLALKRHVEDVLNKLEKLLNKASRADRNAHPRLPLIIQHSEFVKNAFLRVQARLPQRQTL
jgi:hypothetical protein